jgi:hypothetical protein
VEVVRGACKDPLRLTVDISHLKEESISNRLAETKMWPSGTVLVWHAQGPGFDLHYNNNK